MNAERRRALEKELQDILKITNPLVPATPDPNSPTAMSVPEVESKDVRNEYHFRSHLQNSASTGCGRCGLFQPRLGLYLWSCRDALLPKQSVCTHC